MLLALVIAVGVGGYLLVQGELPFLGDDAGAQANDNNRGAGAARDTRPDPAARQPVGPGGRDPEEATLRYRVVDARTGEGIPHARILRLKGGSRVAETDARGYASVTGIGLPHLVFSADDHLLNHYQPGDADIEVVVANYERLGHVEVRLEPDRFTVPFALHFLEPDGSPAKDVTFRIACVDDPKPGGRSVPTARTGSSRVEPSVRRAWEKHYRLCLSGGGLTKKLVHLGIDSDLFDFHCGFEATVGFVANGYYAIIARSAAGGFCDREFQVTLKQEQPLTVQLEKGLYLKGQLLGLPAEKPVGGATVLVKEAGTVVHMAESDAAGRFRIGPWNRRRVHLEITHNWYQPKTVGPVVASAEDLVARLQPRPVRQIRGVVRRRPSLQPVAGARVVVWIQGIEEVTTSTDELGRFVVSSPIKEPQLHIHAKGFVSYKEIINAEASTQTCDLLPDTTEVRVRVGLTALLSGTVIDDDGKLAAGEIVQIMPAKEPTLAGINGKRILEGGALALSRTVFTDSRGCFALEWGHAGEARLVAVKGLVAENAGRYVNVVLGRHHRDIQLILGR